MFCCSQNVIHKIIVYNIDRNDQKNRAIENEYHFNLECMKHIKLYHGRNALNFFLILHFYLFTIFRKLKQYW
jgi:hypothetical protein